jgi:hypothetical protein
LHLLFIVRRSAGHARFSCVFVHAYLYTRAGTKGERFMSETQSTKASRTPGRRGNGLKALAGDLPRVTKKAIGRRGFADGALLADWPRIVGNDLARASEPIRLSFPKRQERSSGTLVLRVEPSLAITLQHLEPQLLERVNSFFGYRIVSRLKLLQGPVRPRRQTAEKIKLPSDPEIERRVAERLQSVTDEDLRTALARLTESYERRRKLKKK